LSVGDYHLGVLPGARSATVTQTPKGTIETLGSMGSGVWNATLSATNLLSSAASMRSNGSKSDGDSSAKAPSMSSSLRGKATVKAAHPNIATPGMKIFIHSPYDCVLATKRDLSDHLTWLLDQQQYQQAWKLIDEHPEVISSSLERLAEIGPGTPERKQASNDDFYVDASSLVDSANRLINSAVEKEKRRIGELWIQQLVKAGDWTTAGQVCGKVLGTSSRWEHWVWTFAGAHKFDEITPYIPTTQLQPPLPSTIYEVVLGHYISHNRPRLRELLDQWPPELFEIKTITTALENELRYRNIREDSVEDGEQGRDWRIVMESLGKLNVADGRPREALKSYISLHDADAAMGLIKEYHLVDAVADDIPGLILLRVSKEQLWSASIKELEEATSEAIALLINEAQHGLLQPEVVIHQLEEKELPLYLFFYLRSLWRGDGLIQEPEQNRERLVSESRSLVDDFADLAVKLFANYDRPLLMEFLKTSTFYNFEKVYLYIRTRAHQLTEHRPLKFASSKNTFLSLSIYIQRPDKRNEPCS
jgi:vacuolar protein sorting-associated protein 41